MNRVVFVFAVFLGLVQAAQSSDWIVDENQWYFSPMIGFTFEDQDRMSDNGYVLDLGLGKQIAENWSIEFSGFLGRHGGFNELDQFGLTVDMLRHLDSSGVISPYLLFGTGVIKTDVDEAPSISSDLDYNNFIGSAGIGFISPMGNANARFRGEARYRLDLADPDKFSDWIVSAGIYMPVGPAPAQQPVDLPDSDGDGVPDDIDLCPATMAGATVDQYGCEMDSDGDGVADSKDRCPNTPKGTKVDARGCPPAKDSDGDGVTDPNDKCPGTPRAAKVDANGCELDDDGDGVVNSLDSCPDTPKGARIDVRGCEIRDKIDLPGVQFELESARLIAESTAILDEAAETLKRNPDVKVEAQGYTDTTGSAAYNLDLSDRRAKSVRQYLVDKGVNPANITAKGYGEANPVADNSTREGRIRNRRVELRILN